MFSLIFLSMICDVCKKIFIKIGAKKSFWSDFDEILALSYIFRFLDSKMWSFKIKNKSIIGLKTNSSLQKMRNVVNSELVTWDFREPVSEMLTSATR